MATERWADHAEKIEESVAVAVAGGIEDPRSEEVVVLAMDEGGKDQERTSEGPARVIACETGFWTVPEDD